MQNILLISQRIAILSSDDHGVSAYRKSFTVRLASCSKTLQPSRLDRIYNDVYVDSMDQGALYLVCHLLFPEQKSYACSFRASACQLTNQDIVIDDYVLDPAGRAALGECCEASVATVVLESPDLGVAEVRNHTVPSRSWKRIFRVAVVAV